MLYFISVNAVRGPTSKKVKATKGEFLKTYRPICSTSLGKASSYFNAHYGAQHRCHTLSVGWLLGLEKTHRWISILLPVVCISILPGNGFLVFLIRDDHNLHEPMYYFLAVLAATDLGMTLIQDFIHSLSIKESEILLAIPYDCFIPIHNLLRYTSVFTNTQVIKIRVEVCRR